MEERCREIEELQGKYDEFNIHEKKRREEENRRQANQQKRKDYC